MKHDHPEAQLHAEITEAILSRQRPLGATPAEVELANLAAAATIGEIEVDYSPTAGAGYLNALSVIAAAKREIPDPRVPSLIAGAKDRIAATPFDVLEERFSPEVREMHEGIASAFHTSAWLSAETEKGRSFSGQRIEDLAPPVTEEALYAAAKVLGHLERHNSSPLRDLVARAIESDENVSHHPENTSTPAHRFGWYTGMSTMGEGVAWDHAVPKLAHTLVGFDVDNGGPQLNPGRTHDREVTRARRSLASVSSPSLGIKL
jgi:hypothetical protein